MARALRTLEACCTPFAPEYSSPRQFVFAGEAATVASQPVIAHYKGPDGYSEPLGSYEDDPILAAFRGAVVSFDDVPEHADGLSVIYSTILLLPGVPELPGSRAEWHRESEGRSEFDVSVTVTTEGRYGTVDLTAPDKRANEYFLHSRPLRTRALAFARTTGALLCLEDCEGPSYELVEEPRSPVVATWPGGRVVRGGMESILRAFGALPWKSPSDG